MPWLLLTLLLALVHEPQEDREQDAGASVVKDDLPRHLRVVFVLQSSSVVTSHSGRWTDRRTALDTYRGDEARDAAGAEDRLVELLVCHVDQRHFLKY